MTTTMPELAPAYPLQWRCHASEGIEVAYEAQEQAIREALVGKPFEYRGPYVIFYGGWMIRHDLGLTNSWRFSMMSIPVGFQGGMGLWSLFMFVDDVPAILAGREIMGEPKKWGDMTWRRGASGCSFTLGLLGEQVMHLDADIGAELTGSAIAPRLNLPVGTRLLNHRIVPSPTGPQPAQEHIVAVSLEAKFRYWHADPTGFSVAPPRNGRLDDLLAPLHRFAPRRVLAVHFREGSFDNGAGPHCQVIPFDGTGEEPR